MANLLLANPRKRRRSTSRRRKSPARRRSNPIAKAPTRRYRRNPAARTDIMKMTQKGAVGALGAFGVDVVMERVPALQGLGGPQMAPLVKGLVGVGIGMAVSRFGRNKRLGVDLAEGAITVQLHSLLKGTVGPAMGLSDDGLLDYDFDDMGYFSPEPVWPSQGETYDSDDY